MTPRLTLFNICRINTSILYVIYLNFTTILVFPDCIRANEIFVPTTNYLDVDNQVFKVHSADYCATKGKEEANRFADKHITWSWFSSTSECIVHTVNDDSEIQLSPINLGKYTS